MQTSNIEIDLFKTKLLEKFNELEKLLVEGKSRKDFECLLTILIYSLEDLRSRKHNEDYDEITNRFKIVYPNLKDARYMVHRYIAEQIKKLGCYLEQGRLPEIHTVSIPKQIENIKNESFVECSIILSNSSWI